MTNLKAMFLPQSSSGLPERIIAVICAVLAALALAISAAAATESAAHVEPKADAGDRCHSALTRLSNVSETLGYRLEPGARGFTGIRGQSGLQASCAVDHIGIDILAEGGSKVSVNFSAGAGGHFALEILGEYPEIGRISQAAVIKDAAADPLGGTLTFAAETGDRSAFVEFDLAGEVLSDGGDAASVNERFASVLADSPAWKDAQALTLALAGLQEPDATQAGISATLVVAVPSPRGHGVKKSIIGQAMTCGAATITCTVAAGWFPPAAGACVNAASGCALAVACAIMSCLD